MTTTPTIRIRTLATGECVDHVCDNLAALMDGVAETIDVTTEDLVWALEGHGRCDTADYVAWELEGDEREPTAPAPWDD